MQAQTTDKEQDLELRGSSISPGVGCGAAYVVDTAVAVERRRVEPVAIPGEVARYTKAVQNAMRRLHEHLQSAVASMPEHASVILDVHRAMLQDMTFHDAVRQRIRDEAKNAEWALELEGQALMQRFEDMRDPFLQARVEDVRDMVTTLLETLVRAASPVEDIVAGKGPQVIVTPHLHPSAAVLAHRIGAVGFATESRALTSHAAILLKGFGIPSVAGVAGLTARVRAGDPVIVDGTGGRVVIRPTAERRAEFERQMTASAVVSRDEPAQACVTADGIAVRLFGNVENPDQVSLVLRKGLEGIGLFRTEFFALADGRSPNEDDQYRIYRRVVEEMGVRPVVIRTFDFGADKRSPTLFACSGENPALGVRGIRRHLLGGAEEWRSQARAILRASVGGDVGILAPMVTNVEEVRTLRAMFDGVKADLRREGVPFDEGVRLGVMIETPAAAIAARAILGLVGFVSLGTNDLLQYVMAADRDNEEVLHYNNPEDPAFLWLLKFIMDEAAAVGRMDDVSVCGEIASRPEMTPVLLRMGYRTLSLAPVAADVVRQAVRATRARD